ncbi:MAG: hypothetical protein BWY69_01478 [Planctomycetes bacterium ADurb.Bin401]|nr:MAG: hypothetical protein BWY69_01478 [Planctomycetes bacterium ADurb.Bin401]
MFDKSEFTNVIERFVLERLFHFCLKLWRNTLDQTFFPFCILRVEFMQCQNQFMQYPHRKSAAAAGWVEYPDFFDRTDYAFRFFGIERIVIV